MTRSRLTALLLAAVLFVAATQYLFYFRDNFSTHYPIKVVSAEKFRAGSIPLWNFHAGGGQPLAGNPNTLTFYPDNVLYLVLPAGVAFNLHFLLHLVAAFFAMRALLETRGVSRANAAVAAAIYVLSGVAVTSTAFYNLVTAVALVPAALLTLEMCLARPSFRTSLAFGATLGLLGLGGEPVTIVGAAILLLGFAAGRIALPALRWLALSGAVAVLVTSPLLIAYSEIAGEVTRAVQPYSARTVLAASLAPDRLFEVVVGPLHGILTELGAQGFRPPAHWGSWPPLFASLFIGAITLPALLSARRSGRERILAFVLAFIALGRFNPAVDAAISASSALRVLRYPEKFALGLSIVLVMMIATWLDDAADARRDRIAAAVGFGLVLAGCAWTLPGAPSPTVARILAGSVVAAGVLLAGTFRHSRRGREALLILTFTPLAFWASRTAAVDMMKHYLAKPAAARAIRTSRVFRIPNDALLLLDTPSERNAHRVAAAMIDPLFGASFGVRYALDRAPDGMYSWLSRIALERATSGSLDRALRYAQLAGCSYVASRQPLEHPRLALVAREMPEGNAFRVYRLSGALPRAHVPSRIFTAGSIHDAVQRIESPSFDSAETIVPRMDRPAAISSATILAIREEPDRLRIRMRATSATTLVVNESYFRAWRATASRMELRTFPANLDRLGVSVPAGEHEIFVLFGRKRGLTFAAAIVSIIALLAAAGVALFTRVDRKSGAVIPSETT